MTKLSDLEYLKLNRWQKMLYKIKLFFVSIPEFLWGIIVKIALFFKGIGIKIINEVKDVYQTFVKGDYKTKVSFFVMGFGSIARGQIFRGLLFFLFEVVFILFMVFWGGYYISRLDNLGEVATEVVYDKVEIVPGVVQDVPRTIYVDNSFKILLYGILALIFVIAFIYTWRLNIKQNKLAQEIIDSGKKLKSGKEDIKSLVDDQFHKTLLALPVIGIIVFTVLPIVFMVLIAFTNYDASHTPPDNLFTWVGSDNFNQILTWSSGTTNFSATFGEILAWTLMWALFATFSNYFLGMLMAMAINKKGIKLKKLWRTILVITIAVPQFVSLLYVSKMFDKDGLINGLLLDLGVFKSVTETIDFWANKHTARLLVILINLWVGIPYLMLITTGILMNIPTDLYESAKIDGANPIQQYAKITLPYMLFVTGPYLLTSFINNMNNFNVIYLLTGGDPKSINLTGGAGYTDLLITWLYKLTVDSSNYKMAAVIGVLVFVVVAVISLIVYNVIPSIKNEEDFQ